MQRVTASVMHCMSRTAQNPVRLPLALTPFPQCCCVCTAYCTSLMPGPIWYQPTVGRPGRSTAGKCSNPAAAAAAAAARPGPFWPCGAPTCPQAPHRPRAARPTARPPTPQPHSKAGSRCSTRSSTRSAARGRGCPGGTRGPGRLPAAAELAGVSSSTGAPWGGSHPK
jgi:hypothetical protein